MRMPGLRINLLAVAALGLALGTARQAHADMMLTPAAVSQGYRLSTFATDFPGVKDVNGPNYIGPLGIAFPAGGGVLVTDFPGNIRLFPTDTDGQSAKNVSVTQNYGTFNAVGLAQVGQTFYMTQQGNNGVVQVNPNGTFNKYVAGNMFQATGVVTNPLNGHLFVSATGTGAGQIFDVNPATGTATPFANALVDGMTVTPDGKTLFTAADDRILGFDTQTGALVYQSARLPGGLDGIGVGTGLLAGNAFVTTHDGTLLDLNLSTGLLTTIAEGGSRGDFVIADPNDGSLLITQSDRVLRLTAPPGGGFGFPPAAAPLVPEPSSLALLGMGALALVAYRWRRSRSRAGRGRR
jgi:hypothetical protein